MNLNHIRLGLNLFWVPTVLAILAVVAKIGAQAMAQTVYLKALSELADYGALFLFASAATFTLFGYWKLWCSYQGIGENCHACGMPARLIDPGKYSPHYRCMACGTNRRAS